MKTIKEQYPLNLLKFIILILCVSISSCSKSEKDILTKGGYKLVWSDEFDKDGAPDNTKWNYESGYERNEELQWYQKENAWCEDGFLIIEARKEQKPNPRYVEGSSSWRDKRPFIEYTSACLKTQQKHYWKYGRFIMRGKIDIRNGLWPAWWTLGSKDSWPACGEIDIMEYYRGRLLANIAFMGTNGNSAWFTKETNIQKLGGQNWANSFHIWRMDWDEEKISVYVDDRLLNEVALSKLENKDGTGKNPFMQEHFMLLDLAVGGTQGGDPSLTNFPARFEVDYVRVYQK